MWIYFFPFWEIPERNVVEILQRSTLAGWKEASSVIDRMANPLHPCRCTYTSERACATVQAHPVSCRAGSIAALLNWAMAVETLKNLCPGDWPGALGFHCSSHCTQQAVLCVVYFFCIYWYGESESCQIPRGQWSLSNGMWNFILQRRLTACVLYTPFQNILWKAVTILLWLLFLKQILNVFPKTAIGAILYVLEALGTTCTSAKQLYITAPSAQTDCTSPCGAWSQWSCPKLSQRGWAPDLLTGTSQRFCINRFMMK